MGMASIAEDPPSLGGEAQHGPGELPPGAAASYRHIAARYEAMATTAEREGNLVRAANQRKAAATCTAPSRTSWRVGAFALRGRLIRGRDPVGHASAGDG